MGHLLTLHASWIKHHTWMFLGNGLTAETSEAAVHSPSCWISYSPSIETEEKNTSKSSGVWLCVALRLKIKLLRLQTNYVQ